jgi:hypothetical protein
VFLTPQLLLLPNIERGVLEYWKVPATSDTALSRPIVSLGLPLLNPGNHITMISCRGEPNPVAEGIPYSTQPFHSSAMDAIVIFRIRVQGVGAITPDNTLSMLVHRRALLDLCPDFTTSPTSNPADDWGIDVVIPWPRWGPFITRWLGAGVIPTSWITTSCGQRCVLRLSSIVDEPSQIAVLDFNPSNVTRAEKDSSHLSCVAQAGQIVHSSFQEPIVFSLPCACYTSSEKFTYNGLLMDEERLIGLQVRLCCCSFTWSLLTLIRPILFYARSRGSRFYILGNAILSNELVKLDL